MLIRQKAIDVAYLIVRYHLAQCFYGLEYLCKPRVSDPFEFPSLLALIENTWLAKMVFNSHRNLRQLKQMLLFQNIKMRNKSCDQFELAPGMREKCIRNYLTLSDLSLRVAKSFNTLLSSNKHVTSNVRFFLANEVFCL